MGGGGGKKTETVQWGGWGRDYIYCAIIQSSDVFCVFCVVLQPCHNGAWTSLSPVCLFSRQLTMGCSAGGDPDPLIALWPSQLEDRKRQNTGCWPAHTPPPQHPIIRPIHMDAICASKHILFLSPDLSAALKLRIIT